VKYRKKPVIVEAKQFLGTWKSWDEINYWITGAWLEEQTDVSKIDWSVYKIQTLEGEMNASAGDYIIKGVNGEFYPCKPDIFEQTYDLIKGEQK
jgi:hypothetical protein